MDKKQYIVIAANVVAILVFSLTYCYVFVFDTIPNRRFTHMRITSLAEQAKRDPDNAYYPKALLAMTSSKWSFKAGYAANALGDIGISARPVILDIALLMNSSDMFLSQSAARSLIKLGPICEPALPQIIARIEREPSDGTTWLAIRAVGEIGPSAAEYVPILRKRLTSEPEMFKGTTERAIRKLGLWK